MQRVSFFKKRMSSAVKPVVSLTVYVWHSGKFSANKQEFIKMPQHEAILNYKLTDDEKISHAACEIEVDFTSPNLPKSLRDRANSILISSEDHKVREEGQALTKSVREHILQTSGSVDLNKIQAYFSLIPRERVWNEYEDEPSGLAQTVDYFFGKHTPILVDKKYDQNKQGQLRLETVTLHNIACDSILESLEKFVIFKEDQGIMKAVRLIDESKYYLFDIFRQHVKDDKKFFVRPEFACSTLVAHILALGIGKNSYENYLKSAKAQFGHSFAYPEVVLDIAKSASRAEFFDTPNILSKK